MKNINLSILYAAILPAVCFCGAETAFASGNGPGDEKKEIVVESFLPIADPFILLHDGVYYAYGTSSDDGFEAYYTDRADLKYWKKHSGFILHETDSYADRWFWAPEVYYNSANETFYLYYSADEHICVATSASPLGPFKQSVREPMWQGEKSIDSSLFIDDDGTPYLFFVRFTAGNVIWVAELEKDLATVKKGTLTQCVVAELPWETVHPQVAEGPSVLKRDGKYYMIYSANGYTSPDYAVGYATAPTPLGPWRKADENPILRRPHPSLVGVGHGAPFVDARGRLKYVFHAHSSVSRVQPRKLYIADMAIKNGKVTIDAGSIVFPAQVR